MESYWSNLDITIIGEPCESRGKAALKMLDMEVQE